MVDHQPLQVRHALIKTFIGSIFVRIDPIGLVVLDVILNIRRQTTGLDLRVLALGFRSLVLGPGWPPLFLLQLLVFL